MDFIDCSLYSLAALFNVELVFTVVETANKNAMFKAWRSITNEQLSIFGQRDK